MYAEMEAAHCRSKKELLGALAGALRFPSYFGCNWDAADECLRDLEWLPARGYCLVVRGGAALWSTLPREAGNLVKAWLSAAEVWATEGVPFHLIFEMEPGGPVASA